MKTKTNQMKYIIAAIYIVMCLCVGYAQAKDSAWVSPNTVAATVKLYCYGTTYWVEGLPDDYEYKEIYAGKPDFGSATVVDEYKGLCSHGSGVIITKSGLIITNAHVTDGSNVEIETEQDENGNAAKGKKGIIKRVTVPFRKDRLLVGMADKSKLVSKGDDSVQIEYIAKVLVEDHDYDSQIRDRAVLQIEDKIDFTDNGQGRLPSYSVRSDKPKLFPYASMDNPFIKSYLDTKVRAIGFPGTGDTVRSAKTSGEQMGYDTENSRSVILHTSYIAGGNSGGGLFFKDKLIGINTWDWLKDKSRPVAWAQPITYFGESLIKAKWLYPEIEMPDFDLEWVKSDPSKESYKDEAYILIQLKNKYSSSSKVDKAGVYVFPLSMTTDRLQTYLENEIEFCVYEYIANGMVSGTAKEIAGWYGLEMNFVKRLQTCQSYDDLERLIQPNKLSDFRLWRSNDFKYKFYPLADDSVDNKTVVSLKKNTSFHIASVGKDGDIDTCMTLEVGSNYVQGPFTVWCY